MLFITSTAIPTRVCNSRYFFKRAWCRNDFIVLIICGNKMLSVIFHLTQPPLSAERKRSQLTPIMKPKIKLLARHSKIARSDVFWWENSRSGLKIQIGKDLTHFLAQKLWKSRDFPDFPRILKILTVFWPKSGLNLFRFEFWDQIWNPLIKIRLIVLFSNV